MTDQQPLDHTAPVGATGLLADVPASVRDAVLTRSRRRSYRAGEAIFHQGDVGRELHLIESGRFAVLVTLPTGDEVMIAIVGPGEVCGEMALVEPGGQRAATVRSLDGGATRAIDDAGFDDLCRAEPGVSRALLSLLAEKVRRSDQRLLEALYVPAEVRVLRRLIEQLDGPTGSRSSAVLRLRQEDLAALAGVSRATANRVLAAERARGSIEVRRGQLVILDRESLEARAR